MDEPIEVKPPRDRFMLWVMALTVVILLLGVWGFFLSRRVLRLQVEIENLQGFQKGFIEAWNTSVRYTPEGETKQIDVSIPQAIQLILNDLKEQKKISERLQAPPK